MKLSKQSLHKFHCVCIASLLCTHCQDASHHLKSGILHVRSTSVGSKIIRMVPGEVTIYNGHHLGYGVTHE